MSQKKSQAGIERDIDENLRKAYRQMADQAVPDRFLVLLEQLRKAEPDKRREE